MINKKGLGKGLSALMSIYDDENDIDSNNELQQNRKNDEGISQISLDLLMVNPNQPRKIFDESALADLSESIKQHGVIQPIIVNKIENGKFLIIAGERRFRASKLAGLNQIPCIIKDYTERQIKEVALIENLQREDLNPIEAARAIKQLMEEYNFTQEVVADRIGKSRPNIANLIRLLNLPSEILLMVENNYLSAGHARALITINDEKLQIKIAKIAVENKLSVRDLEKLVKNATNKQENKSKDDIIQSNELIDFTEELQRVFATKVSITGNDNKGKINIEYFSRDDLDRIFELIEILKSKKLTLEDLKNFNNKAKRI